MPVTELVPQPVKKLAKRGRGLLICCGLALVTALVYWPVAHFHFLTYDDPFIFRDNPYVRHGLTWQGIVWGATTCYYEYWHPLMWWSHELDCQLFGLNPGPHHLVNLAFHLVNTVLVFAVFHRMTGMMWRSAMVAALFALHPLHVESVAWVAERKDLLSTTFWLLSVWAYIRYVERFQSADTTAPIPKPGAYYGLALLFFLLGLLTKPMVVTLPFVLLLLDYWPLNRIADCGLRIADLKTQNKRKTLAGLAREKWPFFALTMVFCFITWYSVKLGKNIGAAESVPWAPRLGNIPVAYVRYIWKAIWPVHHAVLYLMRAEWPWWQVAGASLILLLVSWLLLIRLRSFRYLGFGWLMFLGTLVPTIGLVAVGSQAIAERYMYVPAIGLFTAAVWSLADMATHWKHREMILGAVAILIISICALLTRGELSYWKDSVSLWAHCVAESPESGFLRTFYGDALASAGEPRKAMEQYEAALRLAPEDPWVNLSYGNALAAAGKPQEATNYLARALLYDPGNAEAHDFMGRALFDLGDFNGASQHYAAAAQLNPSQIDAYVGLGRALSALGNPAEARQWYEAAIRRNPESASAYFFLAEEEVKRGAPDAAVSNFEKTIQCDPTQALPRLELAATFTSLHETAQAIAQYREVLRLNPHLPEAMNNLAWILATTPDARLRNGGEAVKLAESACEQTSWQQTFFIGTLAAAYAEAGDFDKAVQTAGKACNSASAHGEQELLKKNQALLDQYQMKRPARDGN